MPRTIYDGISFSPFQVRIRCSDDLARSGQTRTYVDEEGNRTSRTNSSTGAVTEYEWDYRNRLVTVTEKDSQATVTQVVEYTYDVFDRRIGRAVDTSSPFDMTDAAIERYVYDDIHNGLVSLDGGNVVLEFSDPDGSGEQSMALSKRYLYGEVVDQILAQEDVTKDISATDRVLWPLVDNLGTVRDLAKQDGTIATHFTYDSYGNVISGDTSLTRYLFTSREWDTATELQSNRARWYDPAVGCWLSEDPIGFLAGDANVQRYVGNGVTGAIDPSGCSLFGMPSWSDYFYYLRNPSRMDTGYRVGTGIGWGMVGIGVGGLAGVGAGAAYIGAGGSTLGGSLVGGIVGGGVGSIAGSPGGRIGQIIGGAGGGVAGLVGNGLLTLVVVSDHVAGVVFFQQTLGEVLVEGLAASVTTLPYVTGGTLAALICAHPAEVMYLGQNVYDALNPGIPSTPGGIARQLIEAAMKRSEE